MYSNPFAQGYAPKIRDGKCASSLGRKFQCVTTLANDTTVTMDILVWPGLQTGATVIGAQDAKVADTTFNNAFSTLRYNTHAKFEGKVTAATATTPETATDIKQIGDNQISKWRVVSQALKLTLVNNADENDGWFECCRYSLGDNKKTFVNRFKAQTGMDTATDNPHDLHTGLGAAKGESSTLDIKAKENMHDHSTYFSGKLRDIHKYMFKLKTNDSQHDFIDLQRSYLSESDFVEDLMDGSLDVLHIRIHGRGSGDKATKVLAHLVSNQELMYAQDSLMAQMHTKNSVY